MWQGSYTFTVNQWGAGHGGFHSHSVFFQPLNRPKTTTVGPGTMIRVIYDCGSGRGATFQQPGISGVKRMLADVPKNSTIDLLVISHFDHDHVNGLGHLRDELRNKQIRVTRVWAPVLTRIEALLAITTSNLNGPALRGYTTLLANPADRLRDLFDANTVELLPPDEEPIPLSQGGGGVEDTGDIILTTAPDGRGLVAKSGHTSASEILWEFRHYVVASTLGGAKAISADLSKEFGKPADQWTVDEMIEFATHDKWKRLRKDFHNGVNRKGYSKSTHANLSSICLYSGPVSPYDWSRFRRGWEPVADKPRAIPIAPAWLGTGDAPLRKQQHVDALIKTLTQTRLGRVGIASAPHHGSDHDSGAHLWNALPEVRVVTIEADNATPGRSRLYHPHQGVLDELNKRNLDPFFCIDHRKLKKPVQDKGDFERINKGYR